jgi:23S rRNA (guanine1835-N2)-methyltransferase
MLKSFKKWYSFEKRHSQIPDTQNMSSKPITEIKRYPVRKNETLQGRDSADDLILQHMKGMDLSGKRILIVNDHFGALSCGLEGFDCATYTDSYVSMMGIRNNSHHRIQPIHLLSELAGLYDFVVIQIPKNMSFFEDILCHLTQHLHAQSKLICGSMVKHLAPASFDLLNKYIGTTSTSLAQKKARLVFADFEKKPTQSPYPISVNIESFENPFINNSNLFSRDKLDIGTRFFLEHIPRGDFQSILDLGCANGIIGIKAKMLNPDAKIFFSDDSAMALESAKTNYQKNFKDEAYYFWTNCYEDQPENSLDLVLCNPPFHQGNTIGDFIAWQMFQDAYNSLKVGGTIRVIGNSHLGYQLKLKKLFGNSKIVATNSKFMICDARK